MRQSGEKFVFYLPKWNGVATLSRYEFLVACLLEGRPNVRSIVPWPESHRSRNGKMVTPMQYETEDGGVYYVHITEDADTQPVLGESLAAFARERGGSLERFQVSQILASEKLALAWACITRWLPRADPTRECENVAHEIQCLLRSTGGSTVGELRRHLRDRAFLISALCQELHQGRAIADLTNGFHTNTAVRIAK